MTSHLRRAVALARWELVAIVVFAFAARLTYRLASGEVAFLEHGYTFYREIAESFLRGDGLCLDGGVDCAVRVPLYPLLVSAFLQWDWLYPGLPAAQAVISAARCLLAYGIGHTLFGRRAGLIAAGITAINPYSIVHSTAMQDTSLFNMLTALAVWLLLQSREAGRGRAYNLAAGLVLGLTAMTSLRLVLFLPLAMLWVVLPFGPGARWRVREAALVAIPICLLIGGWTLRNWTIVGAPVLTTESGVSLWVANNPATLEFLPDRSVDEIADVAHDRLPEGRQQLLESQSGEVATNRLLSQWALEYMLAHPGETLALMGLKVFWAFSGQLSPARDWPFQLGYAAFAVPLHALALIGWWRSRGDRKLAAHLLIGVLFVSFMITTAVFWAHTSHKSTLHLFLGVYAAFALSRWWPAPAASVARPRMVVPPLPSSTKFTLRALDPTTCR